MGRGETGGGGEPAEIRGKKTPLEAQKHLVLLPQQPWDGGSRTV